ncbi:L-tyrosine/L-tryptophan isonitrile synthase family protein [Streptomyces sp. TS71-3]|uniref:L-tyrosine/L-tryptophan isonitrile synthase family protein n=1 Tax=Streptomyces sp. TS71-3 TaxID=2733862 RepID=UPI001B0B8B6A|nr:L-tyrosine/L-tryptophan isonitrile synthase family protein [Streptomyces sp. TS71-3]GHJ41630.1 hypothetical protein Sm713_72390 [Streptomyces sp. TS71-3]
MGENVRSDGSDGSRREPDRPPSPPAPDSLVRRLIRDNPVLRLHMAPPDDAGGRPAGPGTPAAAPGGAGPGRPADLDGAFAVTARDLAGRPGLLRKALDGCQGGPADGELEAVLAHFVRPLVRVFRTALDHYGLVLADPHDPDVAFELRPDLSPTGRLLPGLAPYALRAGSLALARPATLEAARAAGTDPGALPAWSARHPPGAGMDALDALALAFHRERPDGRPDARALFDAELSAELRFLRPDTARLLRTGARYAHAVHSVPAGQERALTALLDRVRHGARGLRARPDRPQPVVLVGPLPTGARQLPAGLARLSRDVWHAGGEVLFLSPKGVTAERYASALTRHGVVEPIVLVPQSDGGAEPDALAALARFDDRARPVGCVVAGGPGQAGDVDWAPLVRRFPDARIVVVSPAGAGDADGARAAAGGAGDAGDRPHGPDRAVPVRSLETRSAAALRMAEQPGPALCAATRLSALHLDTLRHDPVIERHAVRWTAEQTREFVDHLVTGALASADRTARHAEDMLRRRTAALLTAGERAAWLVHHILQRKQFRLGPSSHYPVEQALREMLPFVRRGEPVQVCLPFFPGKFAHSGLKAVGHLPDLGELAMLVRILELAAAVRWVHAPGLRLFLATDGHHYRGHHAGRIAEGMATLRRYAEEVGVAGPSIEIADYDELAERHNGPRYVARQRALRSRIVAEYHAALRDLDITEGPLRTLREVRRRDRRGGFVDVFRSLVFSVPMPEPAAPGATPGRAPCDTPAPGRTAPGAAWWKAVHVDLYDLSEDRAAPDVIAARKGILRAAWDDAAEYVATRHADAQIGYRERVVLGAVQATTRPVPGKAGMNLLGGAPLFCSHGTGAIDARGIVCNDFAVALLDQGFVPLYSPLLGTRQPFAMVPVTVTGAAPDGSGNRIDPAFLRTVRLRRK